MMEIYSNRRRIANWELAILLLSEIVTFYALYRISLPLAMILIFTELVISIIIDYVTKFNDCPYCGNYLRTQMNHCPHCGGRLR